MSNNRDEDFYSNSEHDENHIDEKWLVSYADMMTLLFGFFVMMYVLSTNNKAKMEETLQKISQEGFLSEVKPTKDAKPAEEAPRPIITNMLKTQAATDDILIEIKRKDDEKRKKDLEDNLVQIKKEVLKNEEDLKLALEKNKKIEEKKMAAEKLVKESEDKIRELEKNAKEKIDEHEKTDKSKSAEAEQIKKLKKSLLELETNVKILDVKNKDMTKENAYLKKKVDDSPKIKDDDHFMMVFVKWDTEKHDIDMVVEDPKGNVFNYKKRTIANTPGEFVIDSTYGPGVESWMTNQTIEGTYKVTFRFYNQYGNKKDAIIKPSVFNNLKVEKLPPITLNFAQKREKTILVKVAKDGQFTVSE